MADGYGVGLFDKKGPEDFAAAVQKISDSLTGVQTAFSTFGSTASQAISGISSAISDLTSRLSGLQQQLSQVTSTIGGGGGMGGGGGGAPAPPVSPNGGSGNTGAAGATITPTAGPLWVPHTSGTGGWEQGPTTGQGPGMELHTADGAPPTQTQPMQQGTAAAANPFSMANVARSMIPAAAGAAARTVSGAAGSMISTAVQGQLVGQMYGGAFGVDPRSLYVVPQGQLVQNAADYPQANYYAVTQMGVAPNTPNWSTLNRSANQAFGLVPGISMQGGFALQNQFQQPDTLQAAYGFGLNFRPGGQLQDIQSNYKQIFNMMTAGQKISAASFQSLMAPGNYGAVGLQNVIPSATPGSDLWTGFVNYGLGQIQNQSQGGLPDLSTPGGIQQTALGKSAYFSQIQAQTAQAQVTSQAEPGIAEAAKNLNDAATKLLQLASNSGTPGLAGGALSTLTSGGGMGALITGGVGLGIARRIGPLSRQIGKIPGIGPPLAVPGGIRNTLLPKLKGLFGRGAGAAAEEAVGTEAAVGGLEAAGVAADATGIGLPVGLALGAAGLGVGLLAPHIGSIWHGLFGGGHKTAATTTSDAAGGPANDMMSLLQAVPPKGSLLDVLLQPAPAGSGGAMAGGSALGLTSALGGGGGGGGGGINSLWSSPGQYTSPTLAGLFASYAAGQPTQTRTTGTTGGSGGTGAGSSLTGSTNAQRAYNYFLAKGLTDFQAAGILGNLAQESNVDPSETGASGLGIAQWIGSRRAALEAYAKTVNKPSTDLNTQLDYLWGELQGPYSGALSALQGSTDVTSAATVFEQMFEAAGVPNMANRIKYAQNILKSKGAGYARGTQLIARTQLAMLHRGEAVVSAADNYSTTPYNRNGAVGGGSPTVHLNFNSGSIVLQVPPGSTQSEMDDIANKFVAAISKPQVLAAVRST